MWSELSSLFPDTAEVKNDHLFLGGCDTVALTEQFGTPLYVFDQLTLRRKCLEFKEEFGRRYPDTQIIYACKAFVTAGMLRLLKEEGLGLDVVSGGELSLARSVGFPLDRVYFHGNNKTPQELELAATLRVGRVVVDNFQELELLEQIARSQGRVQDIQLRLSPGVDPHTHAYTTTGVVDSKFGFLMERAEEAVVTAIAAPHLRLWGLHFHLGSPIYEVEPYQEAIRRVLAFAALAQRKHGLNLREFSCGGGFAVSYVRDKIAPPVAYYAEGTLSTLLAGVNQHRLGRPRLILEPGRAIVAQAAVALYRVGARKEIPGVRTYVSLDGGMGDNIRPALYGSRYEALVANRAGAEPAEKVTLSGKFCESGDILIKDISLPTLAPGDLIAIPVSGAYSIPMSSNYNANPRPAIALVSEGRAVLWRRRETYADLMALDQE